MPSFHVGFVLFPNLTQLDFTGPLQVLSRLPDSQIHIVAKTIDPVPSDCNLGLVPTCTFETCPQLDFLCVPGGAGVADAMIDTETVAFIRTQSKSAKYVTSVCTGAFLLGAAGVLKGRKATTHWGYTELLALVGAQYTQGRVVRDGPVITAGGVTSGIDFGLSVLAELAGQTVAEGVQLGIEYNPDPPFQSGHPSLASDQIKAQVAPRYEKMCAIYRDRIAALPPL